MLFGEVADAGKVCDVTVHREHTVRGDHLEARVRCLLQLRFEVSHVVVGIAEALRFAEADAVDDTSMVQFVGDDGVLGAEQRLEQATVRVEARGIENGVFGPEKFA